MKNFKYIIYITLLTFLLNSCSKEDKKIPEEIETITEGYVKFSGIEWEIDSTVNIADSQNFCLTNKNNVEVDKSGSLLLTMRKIDDIWYGGRITSDSVFGFGDFVFYIESKIDDLDANANFSIFSLNVNSDNFVGLTQLGMAFSYYGDKSLSSDLNYFKFSTDNKVAESIIPDNPFKLKGQNSVHILRILPNEIAYFSYEGDKIDDSKLINKYSVKNEKITNEFKDINYSKTSDSNKVVISLCLHESNKPFNDVEFKLKIKKFEFIPFNNNLSKK